MDSEKSIRLEKLRAVCEKCANCILREGRTKLVFGEGNPDADIMFVGEGPGRDEDLSGRPFVGRSGQLLRKMIKAIGLEPAECFIANIVKCRPPNNRDPEPEERQQCTKFLRKQIEIVEPKILVLLGNTAVTGLLPEFSGTSVTSLRNASKNLGSVSYMGIPAIVTYHPSALLRSDKWKPMALEDFRFLEQFAKNKEKNRNNPLIGPVRIESGSLWE